MNKENLELEKMRCLCKSADIWLDGGKKLIYLPELSFFSNGKKLKMDALLYPHSYGAYETRLFLEHPVENKGQNWNIFNVCGKAWHACSFNGVPSNLSWIEILAHHLRHLS